MPNLCETVIQTFKLFLFRVFAFGKRAHTRDLGPKLYDRENEIVIREKLPLFIWLENEVLYSRPIDVIDKTRFVRHQLKNETISSEHKYNTYASAKKIPEFVDFYNIQMDDFTPDNPHLYRTFNDFFIRHVKDGKRPVAALEDDSIITSAADCRLSVFNSVEDARNLLIKGKNFNLETLLTANASEDDSDKIEIVKEALSAHSSIANFRLAPMDYHRFHSPVTGYIEVIYHIDGEYFTVEPKALESDIDVLSQNSRSVISIKTEEHGKVIFIPIGAEAVGKQIITVEAGQQVKKGDELGYFDYGGSDILVIFEHLVRWDEDIFSYSQQTIETLVKCNSSIGAFQ